MKYKEKFLTSMDALGALSIRPKYLNKFLCLKELAPLAFTGIFLALTWAIFRFFHLLVQFGELDGAKAFFLVFANGIRLDVMTLSYFVLPLPLILFAIPHFLKKKIGSKLIGLSALPLTFLIFFLELLTFGFMREYGNRPDQKALEYLLYPKEVWNMMVKGFLFEFIFIIVASTILTILFKNSFVYLIRESKKTTWWLKILMIPLILATCFLGGRSSLGHRPANISSVSFSTNPIINEVVLNSTYSLIYAGYRMKHEGNPYKVYGNGTASSDPLSEMKNLSLVDGKTIDGNSFRHNFKVKERSAKPNFVIVLEESLGAEFTGYLGGTDLTPNIDHYAKKGLSFSKLYATGTRTVRGIEAVVAGFPPTPGRSVVKLGKARKNFFTIAKALAPHGYKSIFFCGGDSNFDEMKSFFLGNGFDEVLDSHTIGKKYEEGSWGVHDKDLFKFGLDHLKDVKGPYLAVFLTSSNHSPFDYPIDSDFELNKKFPKEGHHNAVKYSDYSLGYFLGELEEKDFFSHSYVLAVADHNTRVYGDQFIPLHKFHIPGFLLGPDVPVADEKKIVSLIDLPVTLLSFLGKDLKTPMPGFNIFSLPADYPGRAITQYHGHFGYLEGEDLMVLRPEGEKFTFKVQKFRLTKNEDSSNKRVESSINFPFAAWELYSRGLYQ
ncbi:MAG: sulfatase-like hydrolase/transferase [Bacteriovoracaceae bacterium]|jgi:phosphoglycerol transferase MdoB-like AlkP superfamily enzyme|nr:sulfatase-like hydrolase/transferase [Bacteriovoracaceae bacterium]